MNTGAAEGGAGLVREGFGRRVSIAVLLAVALAVVLQVVTADGPDAVSGRLGGDYPAFYAAGDVWLDDPWLEADVLYDPATQFAAQEPVLPSDRDGNLYFAYPAFFVAPFVPLAALDFAWSYLVEVAVMVAAAGLALRVVRPMSPTVRAHPVEASAVALTFFPLFRGITGGQNTALSLLLIAVVWRSLHDGREVPAGIAAALLLFKPPLALPFLGALLLGRRYRAVGAAAVTTVALYGVGALLTDPSWPGAWADAIRYLDRVDTSFNVENFVSVPGAAEAVFGIDSTAATVVGFGLAGAAAVVVAWVWWRRLGDLGSRIALITAAALFISPHALYYDAGLLVLVGVVLVDRVPGVRRWLPLLWAAGSSHVLADALDVDPLVLLVVAGFGSAVGLVHASLAAPSSRHRAGPDGHRASTHHSA